MSAEKSLDTVKTEAEIAKLMAETVKLNAEGAKMIRERALYPFVVGAALTGAIFTAAKLFT